MTSNAVNKNCPYGRTKFATTQQSYSSVQFNSSAGRNSTNGQDDDTGTEGLTRMTYQKTGNRNSSDVDTSRPDQVPDDRKMEVCEVCYVSAF